MGLDRDLLATTDARIDRLLVELERLGCDTPTATDDDLLHQIEAAIAPLRLPPDWRRFWERVDPATIGILLIPWLAGLDQSLAAWAGRDEEDPDTPPRALFPIQFIWQFDVELESAGGRGGAIFQTPNGLEYWRRFENFGDWMDVVVMALQRDLIEVMPANFKGAARGRLSATPFQELVDAIRAGRRTPPPAGPFPAPPSWPASWKAQGVPVAETLRGATLTVREILDAAPAGVLVGTVEVALHRLEGNSRGTMAAAADQTGIMMVWIPSSLPRYRSLGKAYERFELDVRSPPDEGIVLFDEASTGTGSESVWLGALPHALAIAVRPMWGTWHRAEPGPPPLAWWS